MSDRPGGETENPQHLLPDADDKTKRKRISQNPRQVIALHVRAQPKPEQPTDGPYNEILDSPGLEQHPEVDFHLVAPGARTDPALQGEETSQANKASDIDSRMKNERL